jgi:hypothetical protein
MNALLNWFDDRTGVRKLLHEALYESVPGVLAGVMSGAVLLCLHLSFR